MELNELKRIIRKILKEEDYRLVYIRKLQKEINEFEKGLKIIGTNYMEWLEKSEFIQLKKEWKTIRIKIEKYVIEKEIETSNKVKKLRMGISETIANKMLQNLENIKYYLNVWVPQTNKEKIFPRDFDDFIKKFKNVTIRIL